MVETVTAPIILPWPLQNSLEIAARLLTHLENPEPDMEKNQSLSDQGLVRKNFENNPTQGSVVT